MIRLVLLIIIFSSSLLTIFRAPTNFLWYVSILVTEFCWIFFVLTCLLLLWKFGGGQYTTATYTVGITALLLYALPIFQAARISRKLDDDFSAVFKGALSNSTSAFNPLQMITGINAKKVGYKTYPYDSVHALTLDFYSSTKTGKKPCIIIIHGGSWAGGDSKQLPELNSELAKSGYHIAAINYRLAPKTLYPGTTEDVRTALNFLRQNATTFSIDTNNFVLLGRSAGGQIALSAAYNLNDPGLKAAICFYGPTDMVWGYQNPTNPLVLDSRKIMEDYLGGTLNEVKDKYINSSATETITPRTPPTLLIYGENDPLVSPRHGTRLSIKLKAQGIPFFELYLPWATHGFDYSLNGPGGQLSTWTVKRFLETIVKENN